MVANRTRAKMIGHCNRDLDFFETLSEIEERRCVVSVPYANASSSSRWANSGVDSEANSYGLGSCSIRVADESIADGG